MDDKLILKNRLKEARAEKKLSQTQLAEMVGRFPQYDKFYRNRPV